MHTAQEILDSEDFKRCEAFHGHVCPGLSIGFRVAKAAMERFGENRSEDEEIVAIVETNACCVDAVQVLTGCTFGKGNFISKEPARCWRWRQTGFLSLKRQKRHRHMASDRPRLSDPGRPHRFHRTPRPFSRLF